MKGGERMDKEQELARILMASTAGEPNISWETAVRLATKVLNVGYRKLDEEKVAELLFHIKYPDEAYISKFDRDMLREDARQIMKGE